MQESTYTVDQWIEIMDVLSDDEAGWELADKIDNAISGHMRAEDVTIELTEAEAKTIGEFSFDF